MISAHKEQKGISAGSKDTPFPSCPSFPNGILRIVRLLPGNNKCCDCGQDNCDNLLWASVSYYGTLFANNVHSGTLRRATERP